jgi:hypothetical protein
MDDSIKLKGTIKSKIYPASNVMVSVGKRTVTTDSLGTFEITACHKNDKIKIKSERYNDITIKELVFAEGDQFNLEIRLEPELGLKSSKQKKHYYTTYTPEIFNACEENYEPIRFVYDKSETVFRSIKKENDFYYFYHNNVKWIIEGSCRIVGSDLDRFLGHNLCLIGTFSPQRNKRQENLFMIKTVQHTKIDQAIRYKLRNGSQHCIASN